MLRKLTALLGLAVAVVLLACPALPAQGTKAYKARTERIAKGGKEKPVRITFRIEPDPFSDANAAEGTVRRGSVFTVVIIGKTAEGFYTYPLTKRAPGQSDGQLAKISIKASDGLEPLEPWSETEPKLVTKPGVEPELHHEGEFEWLQDVFVNEDAPVGATLKLEYTLDVQVCSKSCFLEKIKLSYEVKVSADPFLEPLLATDKRVRSALLAGDEAGPAGGGAEKKVGTTFIGAVLFALLGGFVALLTPCVFPMIPITVSFFLKQAEVGDSKAAGLTGGGSFTESPTKQGEPMKAPARGPNAVLMAAIYSGTIVLVMALGGLILLQFLSGVINHWVTNLVLGLVFAFFALSLLGMYDITLPSWLQDVTASGEGQGGYAGVFFMALTFSIISFACTGPIYGSFLITEANAGATEGFIRRLCSVLAFSAAFASPFFLLALFPSYLKTLPKAGSWMNSVKVVLGFLELAAMVKFLRGAELLYDGQTTLMSYPVSMGLYVAICLACAMYLFGMYRLPHDHEAPETISVTRLLFGMMFLTLGFYLVPGVFTLKDEDVPSRGKIYGWVDSFLLPDPKKGAWLSDMDAALAQARTQNKLIFLDITGVNCTNCKLNERNIFPRGEVKAAFDKVVLLKLYTDKVPAGTEQSPGAAGAITLRTDKFKSEALPLYAMLRPTDDGFEVVGRFADDGNGLISEGDIPAFLKFLGG